MSESKASRRLVKSPPELWSEVSNAASLQRHLAQFGDIRITKLESESAVAWEGEHARGTIRLEPSGWGTRVCLTAQPIAVGSNGLAPGAVGADVESAQPPAREAGADVESAQPPAREAGADESAQWQMGTEERSGREADVRIRPWPKRLAHKVRRWLNRHPREDHEHVEAQPVAAAAEPEPPAAAVDRGTVEPEPPAAAVDRGTVEPEPEAAAVDRGTVEPEPEPAAAADVLATAQAETQQPAGEVALATTVALNAALDSLGRAHHRPYSRA